jgi:hypothetical protein
MFMTTHVQITSNSSLTTRDSVFHRFNRMESTKLIKAQSKSRHKQILLENEPRSIYSIINTIFSLSLSLSRNSHRYMLIC